MTDVTTAPGCRCGHTARAHEHHTWRENCAVCDCKDYRSPTDWRVLAIWAGILAAILVLWAVIWFGAAPRWR